MQRGLMLQIDSIEVLNPSPWNKLEIPDRLNGEGVAVAVMAIQGGYLLFISDDGILLPTGFASTLSDPTEALPIMANQLQKELQPDAPEYVGTRIGRAKVFSSMARRAGVDNTAQILPVKLAIGAQESMVWFVGPVPHPEKAFLNRLPKSEQRNKKAKLFSDEILSNFAVNDDDLDLSSFTFETKSDEENAGVTNLNSNEENSENTKNERYKADLGKLLALKSVTNDPVKEDVQKPEEPESERDSQTEIEPITISIPEIDVVEPEVLTSEPEQPKIELNVQTELEPEPEPLPEPTCEEPAEPEPIVNSQLVELEPTDAPESDIAPPEVEVSKPEIVCEESDLSTNESPVAESQLAEDSTISVDSILQNHPALKMPIRLEAALAHRLCSVQEILNWRPGNVIEFGDLQPNVALEAKGVILAHGKPIVQNMRIGLQLE